MRSYYWVTLAITPIFNFIDKFFISLSTFTIAESKCWVFFMQTCNLLLDNPEFFLNLPFATCISSTTWISREAGHTAHSQFRYSNWQALKPKGRFPPGEAVITCLFPREKKIYTLLKDSILQFVQLKTILQTIISDCFLSQITLWRRISTQIQNILLKCI